MSRYEHGFETSGGKRYQLKIFAGRHFATNEITSFVAHVIMLFDLEPVGGGILEIPKKRDNVLPVHILEPIKDIKCTINLRV
jgi:hypothetical protein